MKLKLEWKYCSILWRSAGLITIWFSGGTWDDSGLHLIVKPSCWLWGYEESWYDGPWKSYGWGPLFLYCWRWDSEPNDAVIKREWAENERDEP